MLTLIQLVRKIFKQLKSDLTPTQLAVGAFLGALAGLTPFGFHLVLLFTVALLFNCSMASFLFVFGALKPVGLALGGLSFRTGASLLQDGQGPYAALIRTLSESPILAYLGFDYYIVAGGYALALPAALLLAAGVRFGVAAYRTRMAPKLADAAAFQAAMKNPLFRFFRWVIAGKEKEFEEPKKRFILLRPFRAYMALFIPLLYVGLTVGGGLYAQAAIGGMAAGGVSRALGVQCTFGKIEYSFFGQRLAFENFQLPDPSDTKADLVRIGGFEADLGFIGLLSKRLHIEKLLLRDVSAHVARKEDGKLNVTEIPAAKPRDPAAQASWEKWMAWLAGKGKEADWAELWKKYQEHRTESAEKEEAAQAAPKSAPAYDPGLRWDPERGAPLVRIDLAEVKNLALRVTDRSARGGGLPAVTNVEGRGTAISTRPGWDGAPVAFAGSGLLAEGKSGKIAFDVRYLPGKSQVELRLDGVPVTDLRAAYEKSIPVNVDSGTASLVAKAAVVSGRVDGKADLKVEKLRISARPGQPAILGLDAETSSYAIQGINAYGEKLPVSVGAAVKGTAEDPQVEATAPFLEIAKKGLEMTGRKELEKYADRLGKQAEGLQNVQDAVKTGDVGAAQDAVKKVQTDAKELPKVKEELKDALDLLKKKK